MANKVTVTETRLHFLSDHSALHHNLVNSTWAVQSRGAFSIQRISSEEKYIVKHTPLLIPAFFSPVFLHSVFQRPLYKYVLFYRISQSLVSWNLALQREFNQLFGFSYAQTKREPSSLGQARELTKVLVEWKCNLGLHTSCVLKLNKLGIN